MRKFIIKSLLKNIITRDMIILWFLYFLNITLCIAIAYKFTTSGVIISFIAGFILSVATTIYLKIIKLKTLFTSTVTDIFSPALNDRYLEKRVFTIDVGNIKSLMSFSGNISTFNPFK